MSKSLTALLRPVLELLEDRTVLSWAGIPPTSVSVPSSVLVTVNTNGIAAGNATIANNEVDYFRFTAPRSGSYRFQATTPTSNVDSVLGVFSSTGQRLASNDDIDSGNTDSRVSLSLTAGQLYYFGITNYSNTPNGAYSWDILGPANLVDDSYEQNDTLATARNLGSLTARRTINNLVMADSADWYRFTMSGTGTASDYVAITLDHARGDLDLRLTDSAGNLVRYSDSATNSERVSLQGLSAGTYYVQVYGYQGVTNPNYSLDIDPAVGSVPPSGTGRVLYLNFDGATLSRANLVRWAGSDWAESVDDLDADRNGITVGRFLANRSDREQVITRMLQLIRADLTPFGVTVQRHTGLAVEGVGATTIFLGQSSLSSGYVHVACDVDIGNNNRTDIAFVGNEYGWGSVENTAIAMADVTLHEAGHTYGLWHVNSGTANESMGLRYSQPQSQWLQNTAFLNRTFSAFVSGGYAHGPGPQNSYQSMLQAFRAGTASLTTNGFSLDTSRADVFVITTSNPGIDRVTIQRLRSGNLEVNINGRLYEIAGYRAVMVYTSGDRRDQVRVLNNTGGVSVAVNRQIGADVRQLTKGDPQQVRLWAEGRATGEGICGCPLCRGGFLSAHG